MLVHLVLFYSIRFCSNWLTLWPLLLSLVYIDGGVERWPVYGCYARCLIDSSLGCGLDVGSVWNVSVRMLLWVCVSIALLIALNASVTYFIAFIA